MDVDCETIAKLIFEASTFHGVRDGDRFHLERQLHELQTKPGFTPLLLKSIVSINNEEMRLCVTIYLKNIIVKHWSAKKNISLQPPFVICEEDQAFIRNNIVEATFVTNHTQTKNQLAYCILNIVKVDFPTKWPDLIPKLCHYLQNSDSSNWGKVLLCIYQLTKNGSVDVNSSIHMFRVLLSSVHCLMIKIYQDDSDESLLLQKQVMKIFFSSVQVFRLGVFSKEFFSHWMEILRFEANKLIADPVNLSEYEKSLLPHWKLKKWTFRTLVRLFVCYGSPGYVTAQYKEFAQWYLITFSGGILEAMLNTLSQYKNKQFVSKPVLQYALKYLAEGVRHKHSWKLLKPHIYSVIQYVIFPIMCHSEENEELLQNDPNSFIQLQTDMRCDQLVSLQAAKELLLRCCKSQENMLVQSVNFCVVVLSSDEFCNPRQKDGALQMLGTLSQILVPKPTCKDIIEEIMIKHILPAFSSPHAHLRFRACCTTRFYAKIEFDSVNLNTEIMKLLVNLLLNDSNIAVKYEAAFGLHNYVQSDSNKNFILPQIRPIVLEILNLVRLTECDELTSVLQSLLCMFATQLKPVILDITEHLVESFLQIFASGPSNEEKITVAVVFLNTFDLILTVMSTSKDVLCDIQFKVIRVLNHVFEFYITDCYEEAFALVHNMTAEFITPELWTLMTNYFIKVFNYQGEAYFPDMMPALHNYITVDTDAFLAHEQCVIDIFNMCTIMLSGNNYVEDLQCRAAKLLEIIILQCKGKIDQGIPSFVQLAISRLMKEIKTSELRVMCLQVIIAALYYDPVLFFNIIRSLQMSLSSEYILMYFINQWISDADCFLGIHDRKLSIIGFCTLLNLDPAERLFLSGSGQNMMSALMMLFDGLDKSRKQEEEDEENSDSYEDEQNEKPNNERVAVELVSCKDEEEKPIAQGNITEFFNFQENNSDSCDTKEDDDDSLCNNSLENFYTPLDGVNCEVDEYIFFHDVISKLSISDEAFYFTMVKNMTEAQKNIFDSVIKIASENRGIKKIGSFTLI